MTDTSDTEHRARAALEASVEHLDGRVRSRLTQARNAALDELHRRSHRPAWWPMLPAAALGAAAIVAVVLWSQRADDPSPVAAVQTTAMVSVPSEELDMILGADPFDSALRDESVVDPAT